MKLGYEYSYVYAALNPYSGSLFTLLLPDMTKESFCLFATHFSHYLDEHYGKESEQRRQVLLIGDGAGAHQQKTCLQKGFAFQKLPPASPELNPVERFFEELRKHLANHIFQTIGDLEDYLTTILQKYYQQRQLIIQLSQYPYIRLPN
jgi:transposase